MLKKPLHLIKIALYLLLNNPRILFKKFFRELKSVFCPMPVPPFLKKINGILFEFNLGDVSLLRNMYYHTYEISICEIMKNYLTKGDTFIDVGANIGYITALAAGLVGKTGHVYSFEPVPEYFSQLQKLVRLNPEYQIIASPFALSDRTGKEKIYLDAQKIGGSTIVPGLINKERVKKSIYVRTIRLDEYIEKENIKNIKMIKIDTEGFEYPVILGLGKFFSRYCFTQSILLPLIICEVFPAAYKFLGYKLEDLFSYLEQFHYYPFSVLNPYKEVSAKEIKEKGMVTNILFKFKNIQGQKLDKY